MPTVFEETKNKDLGYYSFAFSCHASNILDLNNYEYEIDLDKYIDIWKRFIDKYYGGKQEHR